MHNHIALLTLLLLSGCAPIKHPRTHSQNPPAPVVTDLKSYYDAVHFAIQTQFFDADHYIGKTCQIDIDLDEKGQLSGLHMRTGDISLCTEAWYAAKHAELPVPPSADVHEKTKHMVIMFAPQ